MTYNLIYEMDYKRVMPAVIKDSQSVIPAIQNQIGSVVKSYCDSQVALVASNCLCYKIETNNGNLCGYCVLQINNGNAVLLLLQLRPASQQFVSQITQNISTFISSNGYQNDYLY